MWWLIIENHVLPLQQRAMTCCWIYQKYWQSGWLRLCCFMVVTLPQLKLKKNNNHVREREIKKKVDVDNHKTILRVVSFSLTLSFSLALFLSKNIRWRREMKMNVIIKSTKSNMYARWAPRYICTLSEREPVSL